MDDVFSDLPGEAIDLTHLPSLNDGVVSDLRLGAALKHAMDEGYLSFGGRDAPEERYREMVAGILVAASRASSS